MKRLAVLILGIVLVLFVAAGCGSKSASTQASKQAQSAQNAEKTVKTDSAVSTDQDKYQEEPQSEQLVPSKQTGDNEDSAAQIVGIWHKTKPAEAVDLRFKQDGTYQIINSSSGDQASGFYTIKGTQLKLTGYGDLYDVAEFTISGDTLTLNYPKVTDPAMVNKEIYARIQQ